MKPIQMNISIRGPGVRASGPLKPQTLERIARGSAKITKSLDQFHEEAIAKGTKTPK